MSSSTRRSRKWLSFVSVISPAFCLGIAALLISCKEAQKGGASEAAPQATLHAQGTPALTPVSLDRMAKPWGIVRHKDGSLRQGVLLQTGRLSNGNMGYLILADVPAEEKKVDFAMGPTDTQFYSAARKGTLPGGLSLFSFGAKSGLETFARHGSSPGSEVHALRLSPGATISAAEAEALRAELDAAIQEINELSRAEAMQRRESRGMGPRPPRSTRSIELADRIPELHGRKDFGITSLSVAETAAGPDVKHLSGATADWENTVLVGADSKVFAIRHGEEWVNIDKMLDSIPTTPKSVNLAVTGSESSVQVACTLMWELPPASASYSMVAVTTHELEMQGGGSLEERLAKVPPQPFREVGTDREIRVDLTWAGSPTTLWIKVFDDANPGKPVIDEAIALDYERSLLAKWTKPPSELIELPEPAKDTPENLVKSRAVIDAYGTVLDLIPTSDSSVLLIQTDRPPFWATLDLSTGTLGKTPWPATADTLVATQLGKTFLVDRKTKEVWIWDNATAKREAVRLLDLPGDLVSLAAPRLASGPVLVATSEAVGFVDAASFKPIDCGERLGHVFPDQVQPQDAQRSMDPATFRTRASADGALFLLTGNSTGVGNIQIKSISMRMRNFSAASTELSGSDIYLPVNGRNGTRAIPDQAGGDLSLETKSHSSRFPGPLGSIEFRTSSNTPSVGVLKSAPFVPGTRGGPAATTLAHDRRLYLDSTVGVLLIPEGNEIHLLRLELPAIPSLTPAFVFSGETVKIPLPRGTGHHATSSIGGEISVTDESLVWKVPEKVSPAAAAFQLDWTGELGSPMTHKIKFQLIQTPSRPTIISTDGNKTFELTRRTRISSGGNAVGIAGAGNILLISENRKGSAWSLIDGHKIFETDDNPQRIFGDADRMYWQDSDGRLLSHDFLTENLLQSEPISKPIQGSPRVVDRITTGSSSRGPLAAIVSENNKQYYAAIDRDTLSVQPYDFGKDAPRPSSRLRSNATGSVCWSFSSGLFRDDSVVTVKTSYAAIEGTPDATGRYVVSSRAIMDLGPTPSVNTEAYDLPGAGQESSLILDESGRYLLIAEFDRETEISTISVRKLADEFPETFKIQFLGRVTSGVFKMISSTKTLVVPGISGFDVYDLDCEAIEKGIGTPAENQ